MDHKDRLRHSYMVMQDVTYELFADSVESECTFGIRNPKQTLVDATLEELALAPFRDRTPIPCPEVKSSGCGSGQHDLWERPAGV